MTRTHWIGSADVMDRNLDRRVEALVRVTDADARGRLDDVLSLCWSPDVDHWSLGADGTWERTPAVPDRVNHQQQLADRTRLEA